MFFSPNIIKVAKSNREIWIEYSTPMSDKRNEYIILIGNPEMKRPLGRPDGNRRTILKLIFGK